MTRVSAKSEQAQVAAMVKKHLQAQGLQVRARSDSFSMGDSVNVKVLTPDLRPEKRKEIEAYCREFQYGHFDGMNDIYEYSNRRGDIPQTKYISVDFTQSEECKDAIKAYLANTYQMDKWEIDNKAWSVWNGVWGDFWDTWKPSTPEPAQYQPASVVGSAEVQKHYHTKGEFDFWLVVPSDRMEREEFERIRDAAKSLGGWYSRKWGSTPGGYAFKIEATAHKFAADYFGGDSTPPEGGNVVKVDFSNPHQTDKLRELADNMQSAIDNKLGDRLTNTPKRQREAQNARIEGHHLERTQTALRAIADLHEAGNVPETLKGLTTKAAIHNLTKSKVDYSGGYYDGGRDSGEPYYDNPQALAVWSLLKPKSAEEKQTEELRAQIESLQFSNIPGYFPTPKDLVAQMLDRADIQPGETVLEPSAGSGAIVEALPEDCTTYCFEYNNTLASILGKRGFNVIGSDFMESDISQKFDKVVMNPPFEKMQDIDHVLRAHEHLNNGGRLVAIMSKSWTFNSVRKAADFRAWFDSLGGECIDIPAGAFKESGTGVASTLVVIDK